MKVCAVGLRGIPNVMGGIETHCEQLYPLLSKIGCSVTVISRKPYCDSSVYDGVAIKSLFSFKNKFLETILHTFVAVLYARIIVKPDLLHIHAIGPGIWTPFARLIGLKVLVTHHGADYNRQKWNGFAKFMLKFGEKMSIIFANKLIVVGKSLTSEIKAKYPKHAQKIEYIPNGYPPSFSNLKASDYPLPESLGVTSKKYILYVGRLVPEKGVHDLISAFENAEIEGKKLLIVGTADFHDSYYTEILSRASDSIIFAGRRGGDELKSLYLNAERFVLPSYHEGLPIVALEALSAGISILLSDIEPNLDMDLPSECYFSVRNVSDLKDKLIDPPCHTDLTPKLLQFDWHNIAEQTFHQMQ